MDCCRFSDGPMGKSGLKDLLPDLGIRAGAQNRYTGHCLRSTFITCASNAGISDHDIMQRTGHKRAESLAPYKQPTADAAYATATKFQRSQTGRIPPALQAQATVFAGRTYAAAHPPIEPGTSVAVYQDTQQTHTVQHTAAPPSVSTSVGIGNAADALTLFNQGFMSVLDRFK